MNSASTSPDTAREAALKLFSSGRREEALIVVSAALVKNPAHTGLCYVQGVILEALEQPERAESSYRKTLENGTEHSGALINLGRLLDRRGATAEAAACYDRVLQSDPTNALALANLGELFHRSNDLLTAGALLEEAVAQDPTLATANFNLGRVRRAEHRLDESRSFFERAYRLSTPCDSRFADAYLLSTLCSPTVTANEIDSLHRAWGAAYLDQHTTGGNPWRRDTRRNIDDSALVVGFISGDFNAHPASRFLVPVFEHHDRTRMQVIAYHTISEEDEVTEELRRNAGAWRSVADWNAHRIIKQIRSDRVDVLIDLSGHTRGARFDVLARKPAPLQGEWLGYLADSGLPTTDFRIADPMMDTVAAGCSNALFLPDGIWCYATYPNCPDVADEHGARQRTDRPLRFGSFNNPMKINDDVLACWAKLLTAEPGSTLTLAGFNHTEGRSSVSSKIAKTGVDPGRLIFLPKLPVSEYLAEAGRADIALDPFPYGGGTTTFDCLWMGTPVVTLDGDRTSGRGSAAILTRLGLSGLVAENAETYVALARGIGRQPTAMTGGRRGLRDRLARSVLTNGGAFARSLENALRSRWLAP